MPENKEDKNEIEDIFAEVEKVEKPEGYLESKKKKSEGKGGVLEYRNITRKGFPRIILIAIILVIVFSLAFAGVFIFSRSKLYSGSKKNEKKTEIGRQKIKENRVIIVDADKDGLLDKEEKTIGTNPNKIDSDNDGLTDYEEVKIYKTNPLKKDTDNDGVSDGKEVKTGFDPNNSDPKARLLNLEKEIEKIK